MKNFLLNFFRNRKNAFRVSVIVSCYNGENFIEKRLKSIISQSFKPFEIIFLDDASTDDSLLIAKKLLKKSKISYKIYQNEKNQGCGKQLIKGLNKAKGNYIWFAEQDDYCNEKFLDTMKKAFEDPSVNIAYCKSVPVDKNYNRLEYYYDIEKTLDNNYCTDGSFEIKNKLSIKNTIYDLSSVVFKKSALMGIEDLIPTFNVFYDWIMYAYILQSGRISYDTTCFNYHMRHSNSIISKKRRNASFYKDLFTVKNYIIDHYPLPKHIMNEMLYEIDRDYRQSGCRGYKTRDIKNHPALSMKYTNLQNKIEKISYNMKYTNLKNKIEKISYKPS